MEKIPEGYVQAIKIEPASNQTFEVVLLDGRVFPQEENQYLSKVEKYGKLTGYCRDLESFKDFNGNYDHLVVVTGHEYEFAGNGYRYKQVLTGELIPKTAISHYRKKLNTKS